MSPDILGALAAVSLRGSEMYTCGVCSKVLFSSLHEICSQEKCELVQIVLGKPENNISHLIGFKNKAVLSQDKFYWVAVGLEVIYGNLLGFHKEILRNGLQRILTEFLNFFKTLFHLRQVVFSKRPVCDVL